MLSAMKDVYPGSIERLSWYVHVPVSITLRGDTDFTLSAELDRWDSQGIKFIFGMDAHPESCPTG